MGHNDRYVDMVYVDEGGALYCLFLYIISLGIALLSYLLRFVGTTVGKRVSTIPAIVEKRSEREKKVDRFSLPRHAFFDIADHASFFFRVIANDPTNLQSRHRKTLTSHNETHHALMTLST